MGGGGGGGEREGGIPNFDIQVYERYLSSTGHNFFAIRDSIKRLPPFNFL